MKKPQRGAAASSCATYRNARQAGKQHNNGNDKICSLYAKPPCMASSYHIPRGNTRTATGIKPVAVKDVNFAGESAFR